MRFTNTLAKSKAGSDTKRGWGKGSNSINGTDDTPFSGRTVGEIRGDGLVVSANGQKLIRIF